MDNICYSQNNYSFLDLQHLHKNAIANQNAILTYKINRLSIQQSLQEYDWTFELRTIFPNYRRQIDPITQQDGTVNFRELNSANSALAPVLVYPLKFTGGTVTAFSTFNRLDQFGFVNYTNYGLNLFRVSYNQPLGYFKRYYLQRDLVRSQEVLLEKELNREIYANNFETTQLAFEIIEANKIVDLYQSIDSFLVTFKNVIEKRVEQGKILKIEFDQARIAVKRNKNLIIRNKNTLINLKTQLANSLDISSDKINLIDYPAPPNIKLNKDSLFLLAKENYLSYVEDYQARLRNKNLRDARYAKGIQANLEVSFGINKTAPEISELFNDFSQSQAFNINVSIPIKSNGVLKNNYEISKIDYDRLQIEIKQLKAQTYNEISIIVDEITNLFALLDILEQEKKILLRERKLTLDRYLAGKIGYHDVSRVNNEIIEKELENISTNKNIFESYSQLEYLINAKLY